MNMRIAAVPIIAAAMLLTACGLDGRFDARSGECASAYGAGSVGLSTAVRSLSEGHPPIPFARPGLPEGHPPIPFSGPALPRSQRALPDGHPRCPAQGVLPAGPLERGPARPLSEPPAVISI